MKLPYPAELEEAVTLLSGRPVILRPIRQEDEPQHLELVRYTDIDYDREMAFIATITDEDGRVRTLGVVRVATRRPASWR